MSVDFDPVSVRPKRRRVDPLVIGVVVVVAGLAAAVVKPWESKSPEASAAASAPAVAAASASAATSSATSAPRPTSAPSRPPLTWADIAPAVEAHPTWGVAAMVFNGPADGRRLDADDLLELWSRPAGETADDQTVDIPTEDRSIAALGVTFPPGEAPLDARIWRLHDGGQFEWVDARPVLGVAPDDTLLLVQPDAGGRATAAWTGGTYRIDALAGDAVRRITIRIPGRFGTRIPPPDAWPAAPVNLVAAKDGDPSVTRQGPFALVDGVSVALSSTSGPPLDEAAEWRKALASDRPSAAVAVVHLPRATGLGVMFTEHAVITSATIRRIAPDDRLEAAPAIGGVSSSHGRTPYLVFTPVGAGAWPSGVYALTARWTDPAGAHEGTWHVELRPGQPGGGSGAASRSEAGG